MERKLIDPALDRHFESLFELFAKPGWAAFLDDVKRYVEPRASARGIPDAKALHFTQGELAVLDWVAGYQQMNEHAYREMLVDEEALEVLDQELAKQPGRAQVVDGGLE